MARNSDIKAIETSYKGYRFRSRLEARWAVLFDAMNQQWEYEKQGYVVEGVPYLPDFWFPYIAGEPGWGFWVEIKPVKLDNEQIDFFRRFAKQSGHRTYCICGTPWPHEYEICCFNHSHANYPGEWESGLVLHESEWGAWDGVVCHKHFRVEAGFTLGDGTFHPSHFGSNGFFHEPCSGYAAGVLSQAFNAARSARFEHGQSGTSIISPPKEISAQVEPATYRPPVVEEQFLDLLLADESLVPEASRQVQPDQLRDPGIRKLVSIIYQLSQCGEVPDWDALRTVISDQILLDLAGHHLSVAQTIVEPKRYIAKVIDLLRERDAPQKTPRELLDAAAGPDAAMDVLRQIQKRNSKGR